MNKRLVFGKLMSLSAKFFQGFAMAATGEWRDLLVTHMRISRSCCPLIALISLLIQRVHTLYEPGSYSKPSLVKLGDRLVQICDSSCATGLKTTSM